MTATAPPALSAILPFPALAERAAGTYNANAYACLNGWAVTYGPQLAALAANAYANAVDAAGSAAAAAVSQTAAAQAATNAAASANFKGAWAGLTGTFPIGATVAHNNSIWASTVALANVASQTPAAGNSNWVRISGLGYVPVTEASYNANPGDHCLILGASATTIVLPAFPASGDYVSVTIVNGRTDNVVARNGKNIMEKPENMTLNNIKFPIDFVFPGYGVEWRLG